MTPATGPVEAALRTLFPPGVAVAAERIVPSDASKLWPEEHAAVAGAVPARLAEFVAGRTAARRVLLALGQPAQALPMGPDRAAIWPGDIAGSIAHAAGLAVAVGRLEAALGVDIEEDSHCRLTSGPSSARRMNCVGSRNPRPDGRSARCSAPRRRCSRRKHRDDARCSATNCCLSPLPGKVSMPSSLSMPGRSGPGRSSGAGSSR